MRTPKILYWPFVALLVLAPLPLGSNRPIPWTVLALVVAVLLLAWVGTAPLRPARQLVPVARVLPALLGLALVLLVVLIQVVPWTPRDWHHPIWFQATAALDGAAGRISVNPHATGTAAMRLLTYAGVFWLALQLSQSPRAAGRMVRVLVLAGLGYALYGLFVHLFELGTILGWRKWYEMRGLSSTFVNQNSYATYAGLGLLCAAGLLISTVSGELRRAVRRRWGWRRLAARLTWRQWWLVATVVVLALALVMTTSRAGVASSAAGLAVLIGCFGMTRLMPARHAWSSGGVALAVAVLVFLLGGDDLARRLEHEGFQSPRFAAYEAIGAAIEDSPWLGTGYGTFPEVYPGYQRRLSDEHWNHAHNTYLENALELGVPATLALVGAIGWLALQCARALQRRRRNALYPCLGVAATVLVGLHATLDFSLELPGVAVTYAAILGIAFGRARRRRDWRARRRVDVWSQRPHRMAFALTAVLANLLLLLAVPRLVADLRALPLTALQAPIEAGVLPSPAALERAIAAGQGAAAWANAGDLWWRVAQAQLALARWSQMEEAARDVLLVAAAEALRRSLVRAPANAAGWMQLAFATLARGGDARRVNASLALSVRLAPHQGQLVPIRAGIAALAWDRLDGPTRALFAGQLGAAMRFAPQQLVEVVRRHEDAVAAVRTAVKEDPRASARLEHLLLLLGDD